MRRSVGKYISDTFFILINLLFFIVFYFLEVLSISTKELSVNNEIRAVQVRVINDSGAQLGVMKTRDALNMALERGLDLVEIAPTAQIPVCRIMDYGKYKFEKSKKEKEAKKRQIVVETKEVQLTWSIDTHDFNTRVGQTKKWLETGNKVKVSLELARGREMAHIELGYRMLDKFEQACLDFSIVEKRPLREGRRITMFLGPKKAKPELSSNKNAERRENAEKAAGSDADGTNVTNISNINSVINANNANANNANNVNNENNENNETVSAEGKNKVETVGAGEKVLS